MRPPPQEMIRACSVALNRDLARVSTHVPPESAAALWTVATKRPLPHVHGGLGLVASRDAVPSPVIAAIVAGLRGNLPDVRLPFMAAIVHGRPDPADPTPEVDASDPARFVCQAAPRRVEGMFALANPLFPQLSGQARIHDDNPRGEDCARLLGGAVIVAAGMLNGMDHPGLDRERAVIELGIGLTMSLMRVVANLNATRAYMPKPTPPATMRRSILRTSAQVVDNSFLVRAHSAVAVHESPRDDDFRANGLASAVPAGILIRTGTPEGRVFVTLSVVEQEPVPQLQPWAEIVDLSMDLPEPVLTIGAEAVDLPGPGDYRVRIQARRRDVGVEEGQSGGEAFEIVTWPAPTQPTRIWALSDRLGHRLRGEVEPAPVVRPETAYRWVNDAIGESGTVTMVTGMALEDVLRAFGADPTRPQTEGDVRHSDRLAVGTLGDAVVAIQFSGWEGSRPEVLRRASAQGRAATMFWSITGATRFALAEDGEVLDLFEDWSAATSPQVLDLAHDLDRYTYAEVIERGLVVAERVTGAALTQDFVTNLIDAGVSYQVVPWLPDHLPFVERSDYSFGPLWPEKVALLAAAEAELREITWWAVSEMVRYWGPDEPEVAATLQSRRFSSAAVMLARRAEVLSRPGNQGTAASWRALHAATNPDARAALVAVAEQLKMPVSWQIETLATVRERLRALLLQNR
jgi:hypothetical protein